MSWLIGGGPFAIARVDLDWSRTAHIGSVKPILDLISSNVSVAIVRSAGFTIEVGGYADFFAHIGGHRDFITPVAVAGGGGPEEVGDDDGAAEPRGGGGTVVGASRGLGTGGLNRVGDSLREKR